MRVALAVMLAIAAISTTVIGANAQGTPKDKAAPKSRTVLLCPQQKSGGQKVNVTCGQGEKCCYHPLFDNGNCVPQGDACMGIVNPLPPVQR